QDLYLGNAGQYLQAPKHPTKHHRVHAEPHHHPNVLSDLEYAEYECLPEGQNHLLQMQAHPDPRQYEFVRSPYTSFINSPLNSCTLAFYFAIVRSSVTQ